MTAIPDTNELLNLIPNASEFSIDTEKISAELEEILDTNESEKEFESLESIKLRLRSSDLSNDDLIEFLTNQIAWNEVTDWHNEGLRKLNEGLSKLLEFYSDAYKKSTNAHNYLHQLNKIDKLNATVASFSKGQIKGRDRHKSIFARMGGVAKSSKYQPLKELAAQLVNAKNFKSRRNAVNTIKPEILSESARLGIGLSENQAEITITGWLKEMGLPANI